MNAPVLDVIVIGAGHAGLSISYHLKKLYLNFIVFEKGLIGDTWRNQRWDSFKLNTPNKVNWLPGLRIKRESHHLQGIFHPEFFKYIPGNTEMIHFFLMVPSL